MILQPTLLQMFAFSVFLAFVKTQEKIISLEAKKASDRSYRVSSCIGTPFQCFDLEYDLKSFYIEVADSSCSDCSQPKRFNSSASYTYEQGGKVSNMMEFSDYFNFENQTFPENTSKFSMGIYKKSPLFPIRVDGSLGLSRAYEFHPQTIFPSHSPRFSLIQALHRQGRISNQVFTQKFNEKNDIVLTLGGLPEDSKNINLHKCNPSIYYSSIFDDTTNVMELDNWTCKVTHIIIGTPSVEVFGKNSFEVYKHVTFSSTYGYIEGTEDEIVKPLDDFYFGDKIAKGLCDKKVVPTTFLFPGYTSYNCSMSVDVNDFPDFSIVLNGKAISFSPRELFEDDDKINTREFKIIASKGSSWTFGVIFAKKFHLVFNMTDNTVGISDKNFVDLSTLTSDKEFTYPPEPSGFIFTLNETTNGLLSSRHCIENSMQCFNFIIDTTSIYSILLAQNYTCEGCINSTDRHSYSPTTKLIEANFTGDILEGKVTGDRYSPRFIINSNYYVKKRLQPEIIVAKSISGLYSLPDNVDGVVGLGRVFSPSYSSDSIDNKVSFVYNLKSFTGKTFSIYKTSEGKRILDFNSNQITEKNVTSFCRSFQNSNLDLMWNCRLLYVLPGEANLENFDKIKQMINQSIVFSTSTPENIIIPIEFSGYIQKKILGSDWFSNNNCSIVQGSPYSEVICQMVNGLNEQTKDVNLVMNGYTFVIERSSFFKQRGNSYVSQFKFHGNRMWILGMSSLGNYNLTFDEGLSRVYFEGKSVNLTNKTTDFDKIDITPEDSNDRDYILWIIFGVVVGIIALVITVYVIILSRRKARANQVSQGSYVNI